MAKTMKIKYHTKLNHDLVNTRRKSEPKKRRKPVKPVDKVRQANMKTISKTKQFRDSFNDLGNEQNIYLIIGNGTYPWKEAGVYYDEE